MPDFMSSYLAIETSSRFPSIALMVGDTLFVRQEQSSRHHAEALLPAINDLLSQQNLKPGNLDGLLFNNGPGSFTGLRIGASIVQGLSFSLGIPVYQLSAFEVILQSWLLSQPDDKPSRLVVVIDAQMGEVYYQLRQFDGDIYQVLESGIAPISAIGQMLEHADGSEGLLLLHGLPDSDIRVPGYSIIRQTPRAEAMLVFKPEENHHEILQPVPVANVAPDYFRQSVSWKKWQPKSAG